MSATAATARASWLALVALLALACAAFLPNLGREELRAEEGRRALPAREMQDGGSVWVPTIHGRTYAKKPPAHFWAIWSVAAARGVEVDEFATRLPSVLATLATVALLWLVLARAGLRTAAWLAAALFLASPLTFQKAALGEIEALFVCATFAAGVCAFVALRGAWWLVLPAALVVGLAALTKGPQALLAVLGALIAARRLGASWSRVLPRATCLLLLSLALPALWVERVFDALGSEQALAIWSAELSRSGPAEWSKLLARRAEFVLGLVGGCGLAGVVVALHPRRATRDSAVNAVDASVVDASVAHARAWRSAALWQVLCHVAPFVILSGAQPRYAQPCVPWVALLGALLLAPWIDGATPVGWRVRVPLLALGLLAAVGVLAAAASPWADARALAKLELGELGMGRGGPFIALVLGALAFVALRDGWRGRPRALLAVLLALWVGRCVESVCSVPMEANKKERRAKAAVLRDALDPALPVAIHLEEDFNLWFHVGARARWVDDPAALAPPAQVVVPNADPSVRTLEADPRWRRAATVLGNDGDPLDVWVAR